jgi:hypothetical protein
MEILFEDQLILKDHQANLSPVRLQLTSQLLIVRRFHSTRRSPVECHSTIRQVLLERHQQTGSFGFSIKGGRDTGETHGDLQMIDRSVVF